MVSPTPHTKGASSRDALMYTVRHLQAGKGDKSTTHNNATTTTANAQEKMHGVVTKIWLAVGLVVEKALLSTARGVRIESLGTFTLDAKGRARFFLAPDFAARYRLLKYDACSGGCLAGGAVNCRLNMSRVAATAGSPRPEVERIVGAVLRSLHQRLAAGMPVTLSFRPVAEFRCSPSGQQATMKFLPGFREKEEKVAVRATRARIGTARTKSRPTPWRTASAPSMPSAPAIKATTVGRSDSAGRRPGSASSVSRLSTPTDRPKTSHGCGISKPSTHGGTASVRGSSSTTACGSSSVSSSVRRGAVGPRTGATSQSPPGNDNGENSGCRPKTTTSSRASSRSSCRALSTAQRGKQPSRNNNGASGESETLRDQDTASDHEPVQQLSSEPRAGHAEPRHRQDPKTKNQETWLSDLLRRQTVAQAGDEGPRRLAEALKLAHVSSETSGGGGGRLSGRDLLLALRSAGTTLTSAQLASARSVFRDQPDGRVSLAALLAAVGRANDDEETLRRSSPPSPAAESSREQEVEAARLLSRGPADRGASSGLPWERSSCQGGGGGVGLSGRSAVSEPSRLSESSSIDRVLHRARAAEEQASGTSGHGNLHQQRHMMPQGGERKQKPSGGRGENSSPRAARQVAGCSTASSRGRGHRECWGDDKDDDDGGPLAELARIVFHPPSSLERLLHVLGASKITEHPTMPCAALAARLVQMRPGLGKARARQLAAAACRYPDKQVDLGQLHALLQRRFGRSGGHPLGGKAAPRTITAAEEGADKQTEAAQQVGGRPYPNAEGAVATTGAPQGASQGPAVKRHHGGSGQGSGAPAGRPRRGAPTPRLAEARGEQGSDAGKNERRGSGDQLNHGHPSAGAKEEGLGTSDGVDGRQQQVRASASDLPPSATAGAASPNNNSATTNALRSCKSAGFGFPVGGVASGRKAAATRVQSLFRGHRGRNRAAAEGRKRARRLATEREAREEERRPSAAACRRRGGRISRPKGRSTYGF